MKFSKFNANPKDHKTNDCVVRALTKFTGLRYRQVYNELAQIGCLNCLDMTDIEVIEEFLTAHDYLVFVTHTPKKGEQRPKVKDFMTGTHLLRLANHITCVIDGVLYDTWDCRDKAVYRSTKKEVLR